MGAAGGRNYNDQISIAFVFGTNTRSVTRQALSNSCEGSRCFGPKASEANPGYCKVDGSTTSVTCCTACNFGACKQYRRNCDGLPTNRPFSAPESTAISHSLQS